MFMIPCYDSYPTTTYFNKKKYIDMWIMWLISKEYQ